MSDRTFDSRFARLRASVRVDFRRASSRRWSANTSRCLARLFCFTAEEPCVDSESRSRDSWPTSPSLCARISCSLVSTRSSSSEGFAGIFGVEPNCEYVWNSVSVYRAALARASFKPAKSVWTLTRTHLLFESARLLAQLRPSATGRRHVEYCGIFKTGGSDNSPRTSGIMTVAPTLARATQSTAKAASPLL
jgi:hypothetical protein